MAKLITTTIQGNLTVSQTIEGNNITLNGNTVATETWVNSNFYSSGDNATLNVLGINNRIELSNLQQNVIGQGTPAIYGTQTDGQFKDSGNASIVLETGNSDANSNIYFIASQTGDATDPTMMLYNESAGGGLYVKGDVYSGGNKVVTDNHSLLHTQNTDTNLGTVGTKATPVDADKVVHRNSQSSDALVTTTWGQVKTFLETYFDTLYNNYVHPTGNPVCNAAPNANNYVHPTGDPVCNAAPNANNYVHPTGDPVCNAAPNANNYVHPGSGTNPHGTTKSDVGLSGIPNTNGSTSNYLRGDGNWVTPPDTWRPMGTGSTDVFRADHASAAYSGVVNATDSATANRIMKRNSAGDVWCRLFRSSFSSTNSNISGIYTTRTIGGDYMRPSTPVQVRNSMGIGAETISTSSPSGGSDGDKWFQV